MRCVTHAGPLLLATLLSLCAAAQDSQAPSSLPQVEKVAPAQKTETKPFNPHAVHPAEPATKPWFDLTGLPPPNRTAGLGHHGYEITASNEEARAFFRQGLIYAYGFNHQEALRAFRRAQELDPDCAMCFWGEAYVLGPNLNLPMDAAAAPAARAAAENAIVRAAKASAKEQALAAAMLVRYLEPGERGELDQKYAKALQDLAQSYPADPDIAALAAEASMLLSPWDYWLDSGRAPKEHTAPALRLLEDALAAHPDHIAAIHFYIHLVEASDRPERAEPYADRLRGAVPAAGHLLHMPAHIYLRLGRYTDAIEVNKDAAASDEHYLAANPAVHGPYRGMYYPHNVHFYMTAALMAGQGEAALTAAEKLADLIPDEAAQMIPAAQPIKQSPYFVHAQFSDPQTILALPAPSEKLPFVAAAWRYARGVAFSLSGRPAEADQEASAIRDTLSGDLSMFEHTNVPARGILEIAENVVRAKAAAARGDLSTARQRAEAAVSVQDELPYMEPPYWYLPVNQALGAILLKSGAPREAAAAFRDACAKAPGSSWALYGLMLAETAAGDGQAATEARERFEKARAGGAQEPSLDRM
jgi:tetratricopeptide (TPR) repeat protein